MERLTERDDKGNLLFNGKQVYAGDFYEAASCLEEYEDTGLTPEQIRELNELDTAKEPEEFDGHWYKCPTCGKYSGGLKGNFCHVCGQRLKREE